MPEPRHVELETESLLNMLDDLDTVITEARKLQDDEPLVIHVEDGRDTDNNPRRRSEKARLARELLRAAEIAGLVRAELHVRYWQLKGHDDPRRPTP